MIQRADSAPTRSGSRRSAGSNGPWLLLFGVGLLARLACAAWLGPGSGDESSFALAGPLVPWITRLARQVSSQPFAVPAVQCLLAALVPVLLVALGGRLYGSPVGWRAGWIAAFDPLLVLSPIAPPVEAPFTTLLLLALLASVEWVRTPRRGRAFGAGLLWGLAALAHPAALVMPLAIGAWAWVPLGLTLIGRERLIQVGLLALALVLVVAPWGIRGAVRAPFAVPAPAGTPASGGAGVRLAGWALEGTSLERWQSARPAPLASRPTIDPLRVWAWLTLPLAAWGLARTLRGPRRWFQSVTVALALAAALAVCASSRVQRMRVPVEPLVVVLAAAGVDDLLRRGRARGHGLTVIEGAARG